MDYDRQHTRKNNRLPGWDYSSAGCYFVTFCTHLRKPLFGHVDAPANLIEPPSMVLNGYGLVCEEVIRRRVSYNDVVAIDVHIVMPNHVHMLVRVRRQTDHAQRSAVSTMVSAVKAGVSKRLHEQGFEGKVWQSGYYDHIIRDEGDYQRIYSYIENNPAKWLTDRFYE